MQRALDLAKLGIEKARPNPMVGCVIVKEDVILGEGYHQQYGSPHAEPNAVKAVSDPKIIEGADVYVTLEPCAHFGKTPPCADLLVSLKPKRVIICNEDPFDLVAGKGIQKLKDAGIKVKTGVLKEQGLWLNRRFFTYHQKKRPYVILKWAQTQDEFIAREDFDSKWISNESSRTRVHQWRAEEQSIMVAANTALYDNPSLNCRLYKGEDPVRVILDDQLKVPRGHHIYDGNQATIIINGLKEEEGLVWFKKIYRNENFIAQVLQFLYEQQFLSVFIEGGSTLLNQFIASGLWDEARVFTTEKRFEKGIPAPKLPESALLVEEEKIETDTLTIWRNSKK